MIELLGRHEMRIRCRGMYPSAINIVCEDCDITIIRNGKPLTDYYYENPRGFLQMFTTYQCAECREKLNN